HRHGPRRRQQDLDSGLDADAGVQEPDLLLRVGGEQADVRGEPGGVYEGTVLASLMLERYGSNPPSPPHPPAPAAASPDPPKSASRTPSRAASLRLRSSARTKT